MVSVDNSAAAPATPEATQVTNTNVSTPVTTPVLADTNEYWTSNFEDKDLQGWVEKKGFHKQTPESVAKSYWNLEKLFGEDRAGRTVTLPKDGEDKAAWDAIHERLGRPKDSEGYDFKVEGGDENYIKWAKNAMFEAGMSKAAAAKFVEQHENFIKSIRDQQTAQIESVKNTQVENLKKEWGMAYENKCNRVNMVAEHLGMKTDEIAAIGNVIGVDRAMKMFDSLADKIDEDTFVESGAPGTDLLTPAAAKAKQVELRQDPLFREAYENRAHPGHEEAVKKMMRLFEMAG